MATTITKEQENELCEAANNLETLTHYLVEESEQLDPNRDMYRIYIIQRLMREQLDKVFNIVNIDGAFD